MTFDEIMELAKQPKDSPESLHNHLAEYRVAGAGLLACISYTRVNQGCSLHDATQIVVNSPAWIDQKEPFLRHQEEMFEEFLEWSKDHAESIQMTLLRTGRSGRFA
jgi:hypothetical protein